MPIDAVVGAAVGLALQVLYEAIKGAKNRSVTTRFILHRLAATILRIIPLVTQIEKLTEEGDDSTRKFIEEFELLLVKAVSLVEAYAELRRRNLLKKYRYARRIVELEATLRWMADVDVQVNQWADIKKLMAKVSEINTKLDEITRQPTGCMCVKSNRSTWQSSNQGIVEETDQSSDKCAECSNDDTTPKIDINICWRSRKRNKDHAIHIVMK